MTTEVTVDPTLLRRIGHSLRESAAVVYGVGATRAWAKLARLRATTVSGTLTVELEWDHKPWAEWCLYQLPHVAAEATRQFPRLRGLAYAITYRGERLRPDPTIPWETPLTGDTL